MLYQTDSCLKYTTRDNECYLFSLLDIFETYSKHTITPYELEQIHSMLVRLEYIKMNGWINYKGTRGIAQVASAITQKSVYMRLITDPANDEYTDLIAKFVRTSRTGIVTHFPRMYSNNETKILYDPWSAQGSRTCKEGTIDSYRYIFAEAL